MVDEPPAATRFSTARAVWERHGHLSGPTLRLVSYGWAYAAQFALTLVLGVDVFAVYVAATALGMLGGYGAMAGATDLLTRQWPWLISRRINLTRTMLRFVLPRVGLAFVVPAGLAFALERLGFIQSSGVESFWLLVGVFGALTVVVDVWGVLLACLGRPSFHLIVSNGLLGLSFFLACGFALARGDRPDVVLFHVVSQVVALGVITAWLGRLLWRATAEAEAAGNPEPERPDLRMGVTVTAVHVLEIARAHLPVILIQAAFHSALASAVVAGLRFSRAAGVMSNLAIAQHTRSVVTGGPHAVEAARRGAHRLCLVLTGVALAPITVVVVVLCGRQGLGLGETAFVAAVIVTGALLRQGATIETGPRAGGCR